MTLPGTLFATLWQRLVSRTNEIIVTPWHGREAPEFADLHRLLATGPDVDVPPEIEAYLALEPVGFACGVADADQRAFVAMCALDEAALGIHPAYPSRLPGLARLPGPMLAAMKARRTTDGCYADLTDIGMVVPKGRLMPNMRVSDFEDASGIDLSHQFEYLTLVRHIGEGRRLRFEAPNPTRFSVPPDRAERVGLAPIAEDRDDLRFETSSRGGRPYLDTLPGSAPLPTRIDGAVTALLDDGAGLVLLPELVTSPDAVVSLSSVLASRGSATTPALIVAGSGASTDPDPATGRPHNEAVLMTAGGRILGRQRKLHLFNMGIGRMRECAITAAPGYGSRNHLEDASAGNELVVYDLHGLGRVMVLICEDIQQQTPGGDVALAARPDWILTPVLDISQVQGRWTHQRAIEIGRKTLSRVVVSCSGTLGVRRAGANRLADVTPSVSVGVCFDGFAENRYRLVPGTGAVSPDRTLVQWESAGWPKHKLVEDL